jgi:transposase
MELQVKRINGNKYIYDVKSYWCKEQKKFKKKTTYMGACINETTKEYAPKKKNQAEVKQEDRKILNFGDANLLWESLQNSPLKDVVADVLPEHQDSLNAMLCYKIIEGGASKNAEIWHQGNYSKILFPKAKLESQRISELLAKLGNENVQRKFFKHYIKEIADVSGEVVIDSTGMENEIDIPLTEYLGRPGDMGNQTKLIMVIDTKTHMPLYFRLVAGNIADVSTLTTTFSLMKKFDLTPSMVLMDAGYYSSDNVKSLCKDKISFLSRLPAGLKLYKEAVLGTNNSLECPENIIVYNKRSLYIKKVKVDLYGYVGYAYVCVDIKQKGNKLDKFIRDAKAEKLTNDEIAEKMSFIGKFVLVSNKELQPEEILPMYYTRQVAENTFGVSKSQLDLLPLRVHSIQTLRGYMFLSYIALLLSIDITGKLKGHCTLSEALALAHNQYCEVFDRDFVPLEPNKRLKDIYELLGVMVVNKSGD